MPFFLSFTSFANGLAWTAYAFIPFDPFIAVIHISLSLSLSHGCANGAVQTIWFILKFWLWVWSQVPNAVGSMFGLAQLILYATFYRSTKLVIGERKHKSEVDLSEVVVVIAAEDSRKVGSAPQDGGASETNGT
ncbi:hypothetical protein F2P56_020386 [Juglans regia]|uniref:Uncharacterized protein n=1 Tax=Juglans regia TaxID=51240 RepID=A0A833X5H9_JUGRE|nr:hypothetical protein F2P56_020386 [Juglans regia]